METQRKTHKTVWTEKAIMGNSCKVRQILGEKLEAHKLEDINKENDSAPRSTSPPTTLQVIAFGEAI